MSILEWNRIEFFNLIALPNLKLQNINADIAAYCYNAIKAVNGTTSTNAVLCDNNGFVHVLFDIDKQLKLVSFKSIDNEQVIKFASLTTNNILALVSQENNCKSLCISIYDLSKLTKKETNPCIATATLLTTSRASFLQIEVVEPSKIYAIAIGFEKGDTLLHYGNINRDLLINMRRHVICLSPINGIQFEINNTQSGVQPSCNMFISCLDGIYCLLLNDKGVLDPKIPLDNKKNLHNHCCTISRAIGSETFFVVARDDAIYCFTPDGRGPCYAIDGKKIFISWIDHHLIVVTKKGQDSFVICVDVDNKLIVSYKQIKNLVCVVSGKKSTHIITKAVNSTTGYTYNLFKLQELNTTRQVQLLLLKRMHDNALRILEREGNSNGENTAYVHLQYGNNLLKRNYTTRAVKEFEQTIGAIKPYHIISKLLLSRNNDDLKKYLSRLLDSENVTIDHKNLFKSCIDRENLDINIDQLWDCRKDSSISDYKQLSVRILNSSTDLKYNVIPDFHNADEDEIYNFFQEHGPVLLSEHYIDVLETLKSLVKNQQIKDILRFLGIFLDNAELCVKLLESFIEQNSGNEKLYYLLLALYLGLWREKKMSSEIISEYLKKLSRLEMKLVVCKAHLFTIEPNKVQAVNDNELTANEAKLFKSLKDHFKKNPNLENLLTIEPRSLLSVLDAVCTTEHVKLSDIRSFLVEEFKNRSNSIGSEIIKIGNLNDSIQSKSSHLSQYKFNSIEFRNSTCDICRQLLHMPMTYFLCQHSFHKECLRHYNYNKAQFGDASVCVLCNGNNKISGLSAANFDNKDPTESSNTIGGISKLFSSGILMDRETQRLSDSINYNPLPTSSNPFDNNPFDNNPFDNNPFDDNDNLNTNY